ncbi:MAG: hypothetical protein HC853_16975 [Anaerolineae bacterium]|nr:hypothetical protein [Anaerolineae bacterium]
MIEMIRDHLKDLVVQAINHAQAAGDLPAFEIPPFSLDHPRQSGMGDYAVSVAMQLARIAKLPPPHIAQRIAKHLQSLKASEAFRLFDVDVVAAFINIRLTPEYLSGQVDDVLRAGANWGHINLGAGHKAQVEHGSANPTGFATIGTGRNVVTGDTLANTLEAAGYDVHREWYMNDTGTQTNTFAESLFAHYARSFGRDVLLPPKAYEGEDVVRVAHAIQQHEGDRYLACPSGGCARNQKGWHRRGDDQHQGDAGAAQYQIRQLF